MSFAFGFGFFLVNLVVMYKLLYFAMRHIGESFSVSKKTGQFLFLLFVLNKTVVGLLAVYFAIAVLELPPFDFFLGALTALILFVAYLIVKARTFSFSKS